MWNEHLAARASNYSTGVLSIVDADGYPMSVRCTACLDASRQVINAALVTLWPRLEEFMGDQAGPAWKQVVAMMDSPQRHGDRCSYDCVDSSRLCMLVCDFSNG